MTLKTDGKIAVQQVTLTPDLARQWLETNKINRTLRQRHIDQLAYEMSAGHWQVNGDTFVIDSEGVLVDGQHRCHAVIRADFSYPAILVMEVAPEARLTIDDALMRKFADDMTMNDQGPNAQLKETLLRKVVQWETNNGLAGKQVWRSRSDLADMYPLYAAELVPAIKIGNHYHRMPMSASIVSFVSILLLRAAPEDTVRKFWSILSIGSQDPADKYVVRLRERLTSLYELPMLGHGSKTALYVWLCIKGWNAWVTQTATSFSLPAGKKLTNPFPQPVKVEK